MTVPLRDVVARTDLRLGVLTGDVDGRVVRWVHICELPHPKLYLTGQELLLTAGVNFPTKDEEIDHYVARLVEADPAALGFGVTPVYDAVPASLVAACARYGLPLLEVPADVSFLRISETVSGMLAATERADARRLATAQTALTKAAAQPDGLHAVVAQLARQLDGWVLLTDAANRHMAGSQVPASLADEVAELTAAVRAPHGPASATTHHRDTQVVVQRLGSDAVLVAGRPAPFRPSDRAVLGVGGALLGLLTTDRRHPPADVIPLLLTLLTDGACGPATELLAAMTGTVHWRVLRAVRRGRTESVTELANQLDSPLVASTIDRGLIAVVPADIDIVLDPTWLATISGAVAVGDLPSAARQADRLLTEALLDGRRRTIADQSGVDNLVTPRDATAFADALLAPVPPDLLGTLRSWLAHNGNWETTAAALGVHRNTVRHRITRLTTMLDVDLDDPDVRTELWLALRWTSTPPVPPHRARPSTSTPRRRP
ncbi:PucR family transcriptional regulator [Actinophytocola sp.]|uniref:PucR family transcriptional regulator n=1 Tax=Actinophytocola sp. TaxID=1872138 RepID=UPI002ED10262